MRTSFHHQPEAQHPKSSAIHNYAGRLPHLWVDAVEKRFSRCKQATLIQDRSLARNID
jgi:hypothetical protein